MNLPEVDKLIEFTVPDVYDENDTIIGLTGPNRNLRIFKHKFKYVDPTTMEPKEKLIAVKQVDILKNQELTETQLKYQKAEIKAMIDAGQFNRARFVRLFGAAYNEDCENLLLCMTLMDISLAEFCKITNRTSTILPLPFIYYINYVVVDGMNFLKNECNTMHRDIKPGNILLDQHGNVLICDLGIARKLQQSKASTYDAKTIEYSAYERLKYSTKAEQNKYGIKSDVFSLGVTLLEIALGMHPGQHWQEEEAAVRSSILLLSDFYIRKIPEYPSLLSEVADRYANVDHVNEFCDYLTQIIAIDLEMRPNFKQIYDNSPVFARTNEEIHQNNEDVVRQSVRQLVNSVLTTENFTFHTLV